MNSTVVNKSIITNWVNEKLSLESVTQKLNELGYDSETLNLAVQEYKKLKRSKRQSTGFCFTIVGAALGFISCLLTILNPIPSLYNIILYGLTSLAIVVIVCGLYHIFED